MISKLYVIIDFFLFDVHQSHVKNFGILLLVIKNQKKQKFINMFIFINTLLLIKARCMDRHMVSKNDGKISIKFFRANI